MSRHIFVGSGVPNFTPTKLAQHYIDTTNSTSYISTGTSSSLDWKPNSSLTPEEIQDVIGPMFQASSPLSVTYNDPANTIQIALNQGQINHTSLLNVGTNSHFQIDTHIANVNNPHAVTKQQVGLGQVDNTSDANKPISNPVQNALNLKENVINPGGTSQYWRGDKSFQELNKAAVGLANVDNTSDLNKQISTATQNALNLKENLITAGNSTQYWRGDKTFQTLDKFAVGLGQVDNTSDIMKPISNATQLALNAKYDASNPNGFETAAQLNTRDGNNRNRANHTGTQLVNTISDFASGVLSALITGVSFATNAAINGGDSVLQAFGKLQAQINDHFGQGGSAHANATSLVAGFMSPADKTKLDGLTSDVVLRSTTLYTNTSNTTFVDVSDLAITVVAGRTYTFEFLLRYQSTATNTGIAIGIAGTAAGELTANVNTIQSSGTGGLFSGPLTNLTSSILTTSVLVANTNYLSRVTGVFVASGSGQIYPRFRSESNGVGVSIQAQSVCTFKEIL